MKSLNEQPNTSIGSLRQGAIGRRKKILLGLMGILSVVGYAQETNNTNESRKQKLKKTGSFGSGPGPLWARGKQKGNPQELFGEKLSIPQSFIHSLDLGLLDVPVKNFLSNLGIPIPESFERSAAGFGGGGMSTHGGYGGFYGEIQTGGRGYLEKPSVRNQPSVFTPILRDVLTGDIDDAIKSAVEESAKDLLNRGGFPKRHVSFRGGVSATNSRYLFTDKGLLNFKLKSDGKRQFFPDLKAGVVVSSDPSPRVFPGVVPEDALDGLNVGGFEPSEELKNQVFTYLSNLTAIPTDLLVKGLRVRGEIDMIKGKGGMFGGVYVDLAVLEKNPGYGRTTNLSFGIKISVAPSSRLDVTNHQNDEISPADRRRAALMKAQSLENKLLKDTIEMQKMKIQELRDSLSQTYSVHPETIYIPEGEDLKRESKQDTVRNSQEDNEVEPSNGSGGDSKEISGIKTYYYMVLGRGTKDHIPSGFKTRNIKDEKTGEIIYTTIHYSDIEEARGARTNISKIMDIEEYLLPLVPYTKKIKPKSSN